MEAYPKKYTIKTFIEFLSENNETIPLIERIEKLPPTLIHENIEYNLNIVKTYYVGDGSYFNYELNYYSNNSLEFLFTYKIFQEIEDSVHHLECELQNEKFISHKSNCQ